jgi:hypothetical protein
MSQRPRSWAVSIVGFSLAVLTACLALRLAARLLLDALPVLIPAAVVVLVSWFAWRYSQRPRGW